MERLLTLLLSVIIKLYNIHLLCVILLLSEVAIDFLQYLGCFAKFLSQLFNLPFKLEKGLNVYSDKLCSWVFGVILKKIGS